VLHEQLALLGTARISTLHSYCFKLIREYFDQLELDPGATVLTEDQARALQMESFDEMRDRYYSDDSEIAERSESSSKATRPQVRKNSEAIVEAIHSFTQARPDPREWIEHQSKLHESSEPSHWAIGSSKACMTGLLFARLSALRTGLQHHRSSLRANCRATSRNLFQRRASSYPELLSALIAQDDVWPSKKKTICRDPIEKLFIEAKFLASLMVGAETDPLREDWDWSRGQRPRCWPQLLNLREFTRQRSELWPRSIFKIWNSRL